MNGVLIGDGVQLEGFCFDEDDLLGFGSCEVTVDGLDDSSRGVEWKVVKLHL